jgi:hypothetical protein
MTLLLQEVTQYMSNETVFGVKREGAQQDSEVTGKGAIEHQENVRNTHNSKAYHIH